MSIVSSDAGLIDALREGLRVARKHTSPRRIAQEAGVSHTTVYALIGDGEAPALQPNTVDKLQAWLDGGGRPSVSSDSQAEGGVRFSERDFGYVLGTLDTLSRLVGGLELQATASASTVHAVGDQLNALRGLIGQFGEATNGAAALVRRSGGPPGGGDGGAPPPVPSGPQTPNRPVMDPALFRTRDEAASDREEPGAA